MSRVVPTYDEFLASFPAFTTIGRSTVEAAIIFSGRLLDESAWGDFFSDAVGLDAAHNLLIDSWSSGSPQDGMKAAAGPVNSVSAAGVSIGFSTVQVSEENYTDAWYSKTAYGQKFLRLRNAVIPMGVLSC